MSFKPKQWDQLCEEVKIWLASQIGIWQDGSLMTHGKGGCYRLMNHKISRRQLKICVTLAENQAALRKSLPQRHVSKIVD